MSGYIGDFLLGSTVEFLFTTVDNGVGATLGGSPQVVAYPSGSADQITAGISLSVDFDSVTGQNRVQIVASGENGFEGGKDYHVVVAQGTVGGDSIAGYKIGSFSLENRTTLPIAADVADILAIAQKLDDTLELDGSLYRFTAAALAEAPTGSGGGGLDAAGVRAALGLASANLDTQLSGIQGGVTAVKTQTDKLTFSKAGELDSNIRSINGTTVDGDGTEGDPWRSA